MQILFQQLEKFGWSQPTLEIWADADFKCVYCGLDLIASLDNFKQGVIDHLLPQSIYPTMVQEPSNMVLACWVCNGIKRHRDLNKEKDPVVTNLGAALTPQPAGRIDPTGARLYLFVTK